MIRTINLFLMIVFLGFTANVLGVELSQSGNLPEQSQQTTQATTQAGGDNGEQPFNFKRLLTRFEFWLSLIILLFGSLVVAVQFALLRKRVFDGGDILKVFGVTLIIVGTLFLIAAGFGDKQIASAMGLFGTLAGYLLGKPSSSATNPQEKSGS